jgi:type IV pilus assembly protein PilY1
LLLIRGVKCLERVRTYYRGGVTVKKSSSTKTGMAILLAVCVLAGANSVRGEVCDFPLPIQRTMANGNVLFILDSSSSMNEIVYHNAYNPEITYKGSLLPDVMYIVKQDGFYNPSDFVTGLEVEPDIFLVNSDNSAAGRYSGNYLNWLYYNATPEQIATMPLLTRIQAEKAVVHELLDEYNPDGAPTGTIRFGVMTFNNSGAGGTVISKIGSPREILLNQVDGVSANAPTPLAETMMDAAEYLSLTGNLAPIEYSCQKTFMVVLTDGYPTEDLDVSIGDYDGDGREPGTCTSIGAPNPDTDNCSDYMDDVAAYMYDTDFRPDLPDKQNAATYVVGFNIDAPLLAETAANGDGLYLTANSVEELKSALKNVLRDIIRRISSGSAVAIVSVEGETEDHLLRAKYLPVKWDGYLEAYTLPYEVGDQPIWEAGALLAERSADSRAIFTSVGGKMIPFTDTYAGHLFGPMKLATDEEAANVINWTRGETVPGLRYRGDWKLGDIVDSSPVVVGSPKGFSFDPDYMSYRDANAGRMRVVYIGANDAQLHAFDEFHGTELWSYIPETQLPRCQDLADTNYCHEYYVNLTPKVQDAKVGGIWRTVLFGGMKHGGDGYYALDVTDPKQPQVLWDTHVPATIESWSQPEVIVSKSLGGTVAVVGSGPDYVTNEARVIFLNMEDGTVLWEDLLSIHTDVNMATAAEAIDLNYDGYEDVFYIGDLAGHMWRYDLRTWPPQRSLLFKNDQPIQAEPVITVDYNYDVYLFFGTGRYLDPIDFLTVETQTFYCVIDKHNGTILGRYDLVDQTQTIQHVTPDARGWYVDLVQGPGERVVEPNALVAGIVYFTSFKPMAERCQFGGFSWLYAMKFRSGAGYDDDDDDSNDTTENRVEEIGEGVASKPVVDVVNEKVVIQGSDTSIHVRNTVAAIQNLIVRSWRQLWN